ncbi:hypothetical protein CASFOL_022767 [Castilleja foliolosa]|uniref:Uncharacterized protein n=1 Tax=Castilleja foliolosa TaxID=1961234 RepID=A0ABD3CTC4_9LAMI
MESELNSMITGTILDVSLESGATVVSNTSSSDLALVDYETYVGSIGDSYLQLLDEEDVNAEPELWSWKWPSFQRKTVKRVDVSEPDALWFRVRNKFLRFSKYEYALVTGLRFGPTDFDPNVKYEYPAGGVFKRRNGDETKMVTYKDLLPLFLSGHFHDSVDDELKIAKLLI